MESVPPLLLYTKEEYGIAYIVWTCTLIIHSHNRSHVDGFRFFPAKIKLLPIVASHYMGWNKRSTGMVYDTLSGHAFLIGFSGGKLIVFGVSAKKCTKCGRANRLRTSPSPHICTINHEGSCGSMEAKLALALTKELLAKK